MNKRREFNCRKFWGQVVRYVSRVSVEGAIFVALAVDENSVSYASYFK